MVSCIWNHFSKNSGKAVCNHCSSSLAVKRDSTLNLLRHVQTKHPEESKADFDQFCEKIVRLTTVDNTSLRIVDRPEFHALFPHGTRIPTRYHLTRGVMPSMLDTARENIRECITEKRVALCMDQWTSKGGKTILTCIDLQYIDEKGEINSIVIPVPPSSGRPSADTLRSQLEEVISNYSLDVVAVISGPDPTIGKAVKDMGLFNPRCAAHQLHLAVTNAIAKWSHSSELTKIKDFARNLNKSSTLRGQYFKWCAEFGLPLVGIPQSETSRWSSLYHMIKQVNQQWSAMNATLKQNGMATLSDEFRVVLMKMVDLLLPFNEFTEKLCASSSLLTESAFVFSQLTYNLNSFIETETGPSIELARLLLAQMKEGAVYYTESEEMKNLLFFDPRAVEVFPHDLKEIGTALTSSFSPSTLPCEPKKRKYSWYAKNTNTNMSIEEEIDKYLEECSQGIPMTINPLQYWTSHRGSFYPNLKELAMMTLLIPATSVSARRVFSDAGLLDKDLLRDISPDALESSLLLRLNSIGERARDISCQPPPVLIPQSSFTNTVVSSTPRVTYGYMTDESDFDESASDYDHVEF